MLYLSIDDLSGNENNSPPLSNHKRDYIIAKNSDFDWSVNI